VPAGVKVCGRQAWVPEFMHTFKAASTGAFLLLLSLASSASAGVSGRVTSVEGIAIENARVTAPGGETRFTDFHGAFSFAELEPPVVLTIVHNRFLEAVVEFDGSEEQVRLEAKQELFEEIAVSAAPGETLYAPSSSSTSVIDVADSAIPVSTLTDVVASAPGVAENGQGGIFQTYSIRGVARQRVLTLLSGMRLVGERRAGVSASFVDPRLMGKVDVLRGPSSTYYGSGALGGVIQMFPRTFTDTTLEFGYEGNGDQNHQVFGWGDEKWSLGVAHRQSGKGESASGLELNDEFDQTSATLARNWTSGNLDYSLLAIGSRGTDIGKSNTDYPNRVTIYPEESHLLLRFSIESDSDWGLDFWVHPNDLETRVLREGVRITTNNDATDMGFKWHARRRWNETTSLRYGADYFGRQNVETRETIQPQAGSGGPTVEQMPIDGSEQEVGLYAAFERNWGGTVLLLGGRYAAQRQDNVGFDARDETALSGFAGVVVPLNSGFELAANLGTGLRFPSLSERFFTGITPRGFVSGEPDLEPERSRSIDLALRYYGTRLFLAAGAFKTEVEDYIERVEVLEDQLTFVNLTAGDVTGLELDGGYRLSDAWNLGFGGHTLEGRSEDDLALADVPADRVFVSSTWRRARWGLEGRWEHRFDKNDPGSGENAVSAADLVSASASYDLSGELSVTVAGRNLLDEEYFSSADDKVQMARGRSVGVTLNWRK